MHLWQVLISFDANEDIFLDMWQAHEHPVSSYISLLY